MTALYRIPSDTNEVDHLLAPEWSIEPSGCDWQVMIWGGVNPRTGHPQQPLEFQFFGKHYSRSGIVQRAADLAECEHRLFYQVREPTDPRFMKPGCDLPALKELMA